MCLLIVVSGVVDELPLIVAANRDERRNRPTVPMTRLDGDGTPAILGGRDEVGGGTWLATNEHGVVAGLTNRPLRGGPDAAKRTRGELPLVLARHGSASEAAAAFGAAVDPADYNPSWLLVADRDEVLFLDVTGDERVIVTPLGPGIHVLENRPLGEPSAKVDRVHALVGDALGRPAPLLLARLTRLLADHDVPPVAPFEETADPRLAAAVGAICVHADEDDYGTRSAALITVGDAGAPPDIRWTDGPPCRSEWHTASHHWPGRETREPTR